MEKRKLKSYQRTKLVRGVGINDADYVVQVFKTIGYLGGKKRKLVWVCPFYGRWMSMLTRCYSENYQSKYPSYKGCSVVREWLTFSNFKSWMELQDWEGKQLDKDILFPGNKIYGPDTCVFVDARVNSFIIERAADRGEWPIGVCFDKSRGKYVATCSSVVTGKVKVLGHFKTPEEAHQAWLTFRWVRITTTGTNKLR
jgi:hypothetical protein